MNGEHATALQLGRQSETPSKKTKQTNINSKYDKGWAWWYMSIFPSQKAEAGGFLENRRLRLQRAMITPLYSSPGDRQLVNKIKNKNKKIETNTSYSHL